MRPTACLWRPSFLLDALPLRLLVALLVGFVGPGAGATKVASAAVLMSSGMAGPEASSDPSDPATAGTKFRVVDHNIEHRSTALRAVVKQAQRIHADAITLQEICWWQSRDVQRRHPAWTVVFKADEESGWCLRTSTSPFDQLGGDERKMMGVVAIWTGGGRGSSALLTFANQLDRSRRQGMACVTWNAGSARRVCSVHLLAAETRKRQLIRTRQAREVHRATSRWIGRDELVVLAGDFNSQPYRKALDYIYAFRGRGGFREMTPCTKHVRRDCRESQVTFDSGRTKIDYIFFSANRMAPTALRHLKITRTSSDHHMLSGWAYVDAAARGPAPAR